MILERAESSTPGSTCCRKGKSLWAWLGLLKPKLIPDDTFPLPKATPTPTRLHLLILPNSDTPWRPGLNLRALGVCSYSNQLLCMEVTDLSLDWL